MAMILALMLAALSGPCADGAADPPGTLTLTDRLPAVCVRVDARTIASAPEVLELTIISVRNPRSIPVTIAASLMPEVDSEHSPVHLGTVTLYPPDKPGRFFISTRASLQTLAAGEDGRALRLELKRIDARADWGGIEVVLEPPVWRDAPDSSDAPKAAVCR
jgi:hypothetical protein